MTTAQRAGNLAGNVWFTRKAWINAEDRLLKNDFHTQLLMVVYAAYASCLSVILLKYDPPPCDKRFIDTSLAVLSIVLLALSLYLNTKSFKDRAARFKTGYHDLHAIEIRLIMLGSQSPSPELDAGYISLTDEYNKVLRDVENHGELDDIRHRIFAASGLTSRHVSKLEFCRYYWWRVWRWIGLVIAYSAPIIAVIWYLLK